LASISPEGNDGNTIRRNEALRYKLLIAGADNLVDQERAPPDDSSPNSGSVECSAELGESRLISLTDCAGGQKDRHVIAGVGLAYTSILTGR
jgi:hypothetical protein